MTPFIILQLHYHAPRKIRLIWAKAQENEQLNLDLFGAPSPYWLSMFTYGIPVFPVPLRSLIPIFLFSFPQSFLLLLIYLFCFFA